jgi:hypothetical protein
MAVVMKPSTCPPSGQHVAWHHPHRNANMSAEGVGLIAKHRGWLWLNPVARPLDIGRPPPYASRTTREDMSMPSHVLIITKDQRLRNLLEQIFIVRGDRTVTVNTIPGAKTTTEPCEPAMYRLVIVDTAALRMCETEQKHRACRVLEDRSTKCPTLPFLFLGNLLQKYSLLAIRGDMPRFIAKPLHLDDLVGAIEDFCPP